MDHRLAPELFAGTSKIITFYKGYTMAIEPWYDITFYKVFELGWQEYSRVLILASTRQYSCPDTSIEYSCGCKSLREKRGFRKALVVSSPEAALKQP